MKKLLTVGMFFLCPALVHATFINGGFETGNLTGWSSIGDVSVVGSVFGVSPAAGLNQAVITNSPAYRYDLSSEFLQPISGTPSVSIDNFPMITNFELFFGIPWNELDGHWGQLGFFSGIRTIFQANSGDQLSFRWNLLFNLYPYPGIFVLDDTAFCLGRTGCQSGRVDTGDTWQFFNNPGVSAIYDWQSGYQSFSATVTTTGLHTLGFAAFNHSDQEGATALLIDSVSIAEPATFFLLVSGIAGLGLWMRRKLTDNPMKKLFAVLSLFVFLGSFISVKAFAGPLDTLLPGHWYEVPNSKIRPHVPSPQPYGSPPAIINAWNGGFFDALRNRYVVMGGGHGDYAGNELYALDFSTLTMSRIWGPTPNAQIPPPPATAGETYADGNPRSRHTYSGIQYLSNVDKYFVHGGSLWSGSGGMGRFTWFFDPILSTWTQKADVGACYPGGSVPFTAYDTNTGIVYAHKYTSLCEYNPLTNTWRKRGGDSKGAAPNATAVFDSKRKQFCLIGGAKGAGQTLCYDMTSTASSMPLQTIATTGDKTAENASYPGVEYDPISEKIVAWAGGTDVYTLDLTTRLWIKVPAAAGNTVTPTAPTHTGSHSRWRYIPSKNVFVVVNSIDQNVYVYKLSAVAGIPLPPI